MSDQVECYTLYNQSKWVRRDQLSFRPTVYAIVPDGGRVLLTKVRSTGKWGLPGGGVELGETLEETVKRELLEETGVQVAPVRLLHVVEAFFYYDPLDQAFHAFQFIYLCRPLSRALAAPDQIQDGEATAPQWVSVSDLREEDLQRYSQPLLGWLQALRD